MKLPKKTRELKNHHVDSSRWNDFELRDDDIILSTYPKSGTTWTQQIIVVKFKYSKQKQKK